MGMSLEMGGDTKRGQHHPKLGTAPENTASSLSCPIYVPGDHGRVVLKNTTALQAALNLAPCPSNSLCGPSSEKCIITSSAKASLDVAANVTLSGMGGMKTCWPESPEMRVAGAGRSSPVCHVGVTLQHAVMLAWESCKDTVSREAPLCVPTARGRRQRCFQHAFCWLLLWAIHLPPRSRRSC